MKKKLIFILVVFSTIFSLFAQSEVLELHKDLIHGTLPNGLQYYIFKNKKPENKSILNLVVKAGSLHEEDGSEGAAHIIEHMAFNGTTKYKKNQMVLYLQSLGLDFGGDLNAYTSFEETVYKLILPTNDDEKFETGVEVLREWATEVTFLPEDLEAEKKVITEEWRLRQGLTQRVTDIRRYALLDGTRYHDRFPIGTLESIQKVTVEQLKNFYNKWYHPQNMAIIAVGDFDVEKVKALITKYFDYTPPNKYNKPDKYTINRVKDKFMTFKDPEIIMNTYSITKILEADTNNTTEAYTKMLVDRLLYGIINTRITNIITEKDCPISDGMIYSSAFNSTHDMMSMMIATKDGKVIDGVTLANSILASSAKRGVNMVELDLEKKNMRSAFKYMLANKDSITNEDLADELIRHIMTGESFIGIEREYELAMRTLDIISPQDLNRRFKEIFDEGAFHFITGPSQNENIPSEKELANIVNKALKNGNNLAFDIKEVVLPDIPMALGSILPNEGVQSYTLSNGIRVYAKKTDYDNDKISIKLFKREGSSTSDYESFINSIFIRIIPESGVGNMTPQDVESYMKGKNFTVNPYISDYEQGFNISSDTESLPEALKYMSYLITNYKIDDNIFANTIADVREGIKNRYNSPERVYRDEIGKLYSGGYERRLPMTTEELDKVTKEGILKVYNDKFSNFNGYCMTVVGSFDDEELPHMLKKYFASLPSSEIVKSPEKLPIKVPKGIVRKTITQGTDEKATVTMIFPYKHTYTENNRILFSSLARHFNMSLTTDIREKLGGTYYIRSTPVLSPNTMGENRLIISFSCDTKRVDEIKNAVIETMKRVVNGPMLQGMVNTLCENYAFSHASDILTNAYWSNYYYQKMTVGESFSIPTAEDYKKIVTTDNLKAFAKKAIDFNNYIEVILMPEKTK